jgi:hypothetical protein
MDSGEIAKGLEAKYPTPSLHLSDGTVQAAIDASGKMAGASLLFMISRVPDRFLSDYDAEYFNRTREKRFGKPLKQIQAEIDRNQVLADLKEPAKDVVALLNKQGGPFFLGKTRWSPPPIPLQTRTQGSSDFLVQQLPMPMSPLRQPSSG